MWQFRENRIKKKMEKVVVERLLCNIQNIDRLGLDCHRNRILNDTLVAWDLTRAPFCFSFFFNNFFILLYSLNFFVLYYFWHGIDWNWQNFLFGFELISFNLNNFFLTKPKILLVLFDHSFIDDVVTFLNYALTHKL